jgi:hypothetical protein
LSTAAGPSLDAELFLVFTLIDTRGKKPHTVKDITGKKSEGTNKLGDTTTTSLTP